MDRAAIVDRVAAQGRMVRAGAAVAGVGGALWLTAWSDYQARDVPNSPDQAAYYEDTLVPRFRTGASLFGVGLAGAAGAGAAAWLRLRDADATLALLPGGTGGLSIRW